ncbi:MAG: histidine--tRNA ligase [Syntrophales bacterium]|jgi:histidyl-tRNA synthetase
MENISIVKGFKDILPQGVHKWHYIEQKARDIFTTFGFREIRPPIVEKTDLFRRSIGETTDIVEKEMYTFLDRGGEFLTLRPEATASILRAYIEHSLFNSEPVSKLFAIGPMFRRERPQKGRFRQFHQIDAEMLGVDDPGSDAEIILMLIHYLRALLLPEIHLEINSLGCSECRPSFREAVVAYLAGQETGLCGDCVRRMNINPLRVFDCKVEACRQLIADAPQIPEFLCEDCRKHFDEVQDALHQFDLPFSVNPRMVRGLDYYTRTTFELTSTSLGAQNAVVGGGRYDHLVRDLGGPDIPGIGFAIGCERLLSMMNEEAFPKSPAPILFIAALGDNARRWAFITCNKMRMKGLAVEMEHGEKSLKAQMKKADKLRSHFTLLVGDREFSDHQAPLRNMKTGVQQTIQLGKLEEILMETIKEG